MCVLSVRIHGSPCPRTGSCLLHDHIELRVFSPALPVCRRDLLLETHNESGEQDAVTSSLR